MKKVLVALLLITLLFTLCACGFMGKGQVNSLVDKYGTPQAQLTLNYKTSSGDNVEVRVIYNLLLDKAPLAVIRFIQLADAGEYDDTLVDTLNKDHDYLIMGRYKKIDSKYYDVRSGGTTFAGEFKQNGYPKPKGGYATFDMFSLAMYHANDGKQFDSANGTLILSLSGAKQDKTLNSANYAVFAEFVEMYVSINEGAERHYSKVNGDVRANLYSFSSRVSRNIYDYYDDTKGSVSIQVMSTSVTLHVEMLGEQDWSKLPTID